MFHVKIIINIISRNHKTLRSCVAPSVSPGSISILTRQSKVPADFRWLLSEQSLKEAHSSFNFQSFPRVDPLLSRKELLLLSLYCLIQRASLFKNILGSLSKRGKNYKKKNKKNILKFLEI